MLAPICLFTYNRLEETIETINSLKKNYHARESNLIIFSDGPKNEKTKEEVFKVRNYLKDVNGFKSIKIIESDVNKGLAKSITDGVTSVINEYGRVIVIEDDLILSKNFLAFLNQSLDFYEVDSEVFSISGFSVKVELPRNYVGDNYFYGRPHSWGWSTWKDRWNKVAWDTQYFQKILEGNNNRKAFNKWGTDLLSMLKKSMKGEIDSWYIKFAINQIVAGKYSVYPLYSKVLNIGFMKDATHCDTYNRVKVNFDPGDKKEFSFNKIIKLDEDINKQVLKYKTLSFRAINKVLTQAMKLGLISQRKMMK